MNDDFKLLLIEGWQRDFPLTQRPFAKLARKSGVSEATIVEILRQMQIEGVLTRVGAVVRPNTVGASTLAAMKVPSCELQEIAEIVNAEPGVNHNYEREHELNLWFVATAGDKKGLEAVLRRISARTGIEILSLPLKKAHHIDLGFSVTNSVCSGHDRRTGGLPPPTIDIGDEDRLLLAAIEDGLPLVPRPYAVVAQRLGVDECKLIERLAALIEGLVISRFGLVIRHRKIGFTDNAMAVWNIADSQVDALGDLLASKPFVTLCYQRRRVQPHWPYNLFCMIHGNQRADVLGQIDELNGLVTAHGNTGHRGHAVLFSKKCFKQRGARFSTAKNNTVPWANSSMEQSHA